MSLNSILNDPELNEAYKAFCREQERINDEPERIRTHEHLQLNRALDYKTDPYGNIIFSGIFCTSTNCIENLLKRVHSIGKRSTITSIIENNKTDIEYFFVVEKGRQTIAYAFDINTHYDNSQKYVLRPLMKETWRGIRFPGYKSFASIKFFDELNTKDISFFNYGIDELDDEKSIPQLDHYDSLMHELCSILQKYYRQSVEWTYDNKIKSPFILKRDTFSVNGSENRFYERKTKYALQIERDSLYLKPVDCYNYEIDEKAYKEIISLNKLGSLKNNCKKPAA